MMSNLQLLLRILVADERKDREIDMCFQIGSAMPDKCGDKRDLRYPDRLGLHSRALPTALAREDPSRSGYNFLGASNLLAPSVVRKRSMRKEVLERSLRTLGRSLLDTVYIAKNTAQLWDPA